MTTGDQMDRPPYSQGDSRYAPQRRLPEIRLLGVTFESDCIVNGVEIKAGTTIPCAPPSEITATKSVTELTAENPNLAEYIAQLERELAEARNRLAEKDRVHDIALLRRVQMAEHERDALLEELIAARSAIAPPDMVLVPREPTEAMSQAYYKGIEGAGSLNFYPVWQNILAVISPSLPVEETAPKGSALNTLDIIANWGDEENEWDAVVKYRSVRDMAKTRVAILRSYMKGEPVGHGYDRAASLNAGHYVCLCGGACSRPDAKEPSK